MPSAAEIREQVASEETRRSTLAVPAFAGGFLYLLSAIIIFKTLNGGPTVGLLQGLAPALSGVANPAQSPATAEVKYLSHQGFALIAGSVIAALSIVCADARPAGCCRRVEFPPPARVAAGAPAGPVRRCRVALLSVGHQVTSAIEAHSFMVSHDYTQPAVEKR